MISTHAGVSGVLTGPNSYRGDHSQLTPDGSTLTGMISMATPAERMGLQVLPGFAYGGARPRASRQRLTKLGFVNDETRAAA